MKKTFILLYFLSFPALGFAANPKWGGQWEITLDSESMGGEKFSPQLINDCFNTGDIIKISGLEMYVAYAGLAGKNPFAGEFKYEVDTDHGHARINKSSGNIFLEESDSSIGAKICTLEVSYTDSSISSVKTCRQGKNLIALVKMSGRKTGRCGFKGSDSF